ncbi:phosphonate metabolism protein/1,5-bisphosphokinase (PRPP-forming) PhnN [Roseinatronobacter sp.]|uniref:phosphonate metabolism protein/1,5-bisphosphokinase (PRPP-forming) PhnN n=1 Tax=Roseinatronobacter sp. TaxID=1945755 RepID=UPI0025F1634C|nr:phosphonate metabolism protein/1,5-bisphosphokinase (PRPP-forming) PhnN [Roseibaca sp.]
MSTHGERGLLVAIVGPSGVGKDTLIDALARARPEYHFAQRIITRAANAGGEAHKAVSHALFEAQLAMGSYAFHWQAHGLRYAIAASIDQHLAAGRVVVFNGSRKTLPDIAHAYPQLLVLMITAPADILAARLAERGRENARDITARLKRADLPPPEGATVIMNDGTLDAALAQIEAAISRARQNA